MTFTLLGILVGALVGHLFTKDRDAVAKRAILEREADIRRRHFRRHVRRCRYVLERTPHNQPDLVWTRYCEMAPDILAEAALVDGDFPNTPHLQSLVDHAGHWRREDAEDEGRKSNRALRDVLRDAIKALDDATRD